MCRLGLKAFRQQLFLHKFFKRSWLMQFGVHVVCIPNMTRYTVSASIKQPSGTVEAVWAQRDVHPCVAFCTITPPLKCKCGLFTFQDQFLNLICPFAFHLGDFSSCVSQYEAPVCVWTALCFTFIIGCKEHIIVRAPFPSDLRQPGKWWFPTLSQGFYPSRSSLR